MFLSCDRLSSLNLSYFSASSATDMQFMLCGFSSLISLDLSNFNTSAATNMGSMFK